MSEASLDQIIERARDFLAEDDDPVTRAELEAILENEDEAALRDRFGATLQFGTAGLRGRMGAGTNRMNSVIVRRATWGLARYLLDEVAGTKDRGVIIGFDGRKNSRRFAEDAAAVLAGLGVPARVFADPVPTPLCAWAVTARNAAAGIMVTASHNPPADNGYKVYWGNGAQIIPPQDAGIAACIAQAPADMARLDPFTAAEMDLRENLGPELEAAYLEAILGAGWYPEDGRSRLSIVYTAMHGVGNRLVRAALTSAGFPKVVSVPSQADPDGNFPTVEFPNPEEKGALDEAFALAAETKPDLILANDPDADRISVTVRTDDGWRTLSGNEVGVLLGADALEHANTGDKKKLVITTIVSSTWLGRVARDLGADYAETLTGFKWIANTAMQREAGGKVQFVCGYEEALGVSVGPLVRDKDGVSAVLRLAELAAALKLKGQDLPARLDELALKHGLSAGCQWSVTKPGASGAAEIQAAMDKLRAEPPADLDGSKVTARTDLAREGDGDGWDAGELPRSNVLVFHTEDETRLTVRPSGTEPKIKFYLEAVARPANADALEAARDSLAERLERIQAEVGQRLGL